MRIRGTAAIAGALALCGAGLAAAAGGGGFGGFETESKTVTKTMQAESKVAKVTCPAGTVPVSAGFRTSAEPNSGPVLKRSLATKSGSKTAASLFLSNARASRIAPPDVGARRGHEPHSLTGYVNCAKRAPEISKRSERTAVAPEELESVKSRCPQGTRVVAGGFKTKYNPEPDNFTGAVVFGSHPAGQRGWRVRARGVNSGPTTPLTAIAYCADVSGLTIERDTVPGNAEDYATAVARCPGDRIAIAGGFKSAVAPFGEIDVLLLPTESRRAGAGKWKAVGVQGFFGGPPKWKAYAICA